MNNKYTPNVFYLDKWNNYKEDDPNRLSQLNSVYESCKDSKITQVHFDYEGHGFHHNAALAMMDELRKLGINEDNGYSFSIVYQTYEFKIYNNLTNEDVEEIHKLQATY